MFGRLLRGCAGCALLCLPFLGGAAHAECIAYDDYIRPLGVHYPDGYTRCMAYSPPYLFLAGDSRVLTVLDCSDPSDLVVCGALDLPGAVRKLDVRGTIVAVTYADSDTLQLLDIGDPESPVFLGAVEIPAAPSSVALSATHAYVPAWDYMQDNHGVYVVDLSDAQAPRVVGRIEVEDYPDEIVLAGSYGFVIDAWGLTVLDLTAPEEPIALGSVIVPGDARYLAARLPYVFVVCDADEYPAPGNGLYVIDVSNPLAPGIVGMLAAEEAPHCGIGLWEHYALVGTYGAGFALIDISDPSAPAIAAQVGVQSRTRAFCIDGSLLLAGPESIASYRLSPLLTPDPAATIPETPEARLVAALEGHAYCVRNGGEDFCVADLTNPADPRVTGSLPLGLALPTALTVAAMPDGRRFAYVGAGVSGEGVHIIDVTDPAAPAYESFLPLTHSPSDIDLEGSYLYVMAGHLGLLIYDVANPAQPLYQGSLAFGYSASVVRAAGTTLYVGRRVGDDIEKLFVIDASDPQTPAILGTSRVPDLPFDFRVEGSLLYIADASEGLLIMDVGDPTQPQLVSRLRTTENSRALALLGGNAYLADTNENGGFQVIDVSDPMAPRLAGYYPARFPCDLEVVSDHLLLATYHEDVEIAPPDCGSPQVAVPGLAAPGAPRIVLGANPSPRPASITLEMPVSAETRVTVHDPLGRLLRELHAGPLAPGTHTLLWDGCARAGQRMPAGAYYLKVVTGRESRGRALILVR